MRTNEWHDTSIALAKPSAEQLSSPPCRSSFGAKAIECTRMSSSPHCCAIASNTASSSPGTLTSSGRKSGASSALRQRLDVRPRLLVEVGDRELGAELAERLGAAVGDRDVVGDADDQRLLAVQHRAGNFGHSSSTLRSVDCRRARASVWRAIISSSLVGIDPGRDAARGGADARPVRRRWPRGRARRRARPRRGRPARGGRGCSRRCRR